MGCLSMRRTDRSDDSRKQRGAAVDATNAEEVLRFWRQAGANRWFAGDDEFDRTIGARFFGVHEAAVRGELSDWQHSPDGALALLILLDQMPRNMFRGSSRAFLSDPQARGLAHLALSRGFDGAVEPIMRQFFYLPFMHSELIADQKRSVQLYSQFGDPEQLRHAQCHRDVILRFGRFPHRNRVMNRVSTIAELQFLAAGGYAG
jgi:uncharacterized protein (DUF924 family)